MQESVGADLAVLQAAWRLPGRYLVLMRPEVAASQMQESSRRLRAIRSRGGSLLEVLHICTGALRDFLVKTGSDALQLVAPLEVRLYCAAEQLLCRSVWSERSGVTSSHKSISQCRQMMSCSSYAPDGAPAGQTAAASSHSPHKTQPPNAVEGLVLTPASLFAGHQRAVCRLQWAGH